MKKRLAVLALVVALASVSAADLYWSEDSLTGTVGQTLTVQIITSSYQPYPGPVWVGSDDEAVGGISDITALPGAGAGSVITKASDDVWSVMSGDHGFPLTGPPAPAWEVSIRCDAIGTYMVSSDYYAAAGPDDILTINVVPEPTSIALLVAGSFVLRRRRG